MAGSGKRAVSVALAGAIAFGGVGLAGCDSTQSKNARAKLGATRLLASREPQRVTRHSREVRVVHVTLVRGRHSSAIVVELRSRAAHPLTDVPIAVGIRRPGGRREPINAARRLDWFQTHVPAIPARGTATWVFTAQHVKVPAGRPFATVGASLSPAISRAGSLPRVLTTASPDTRPHRTAIRVTVDNVSDIPQYRLQVYAVVRVHGRCIAAGKVAIEHLGTGQTATADVPLTGPVRGRAVRVHAIPTIFE